MQSRSPSTTDEAFPGRAAALVLLVAVLLAGVLTACAPKPSADQEPPRAAAPPRTDAGVLYVAIAAREAGRAADWLPRSPIRLWFEPLNGVRTAIVDAPVNTYSVPTIHDGDRLWAAASSAGTTVGCARECEADGFVGRITDTEAQQRWRDGILTITAGRDAAVFAPTRAPVPDRSSCDTSSIDVLPCARLVTVSGWQDGVVVGALRTSPVTVALTGTGDHRLMTFREGGGAVRVTILIADGRGTSEAGSARTAGSCSGSCDGSAFVEAMLRATATFDVHASSILVTAGDRTLQLEAR